MMKLNIAAAVILASGTCLSTVVQAQEVYDFTDSKGQPFIIAKYYGTNNGPFGANDEVSSWNLSPEMIGQLNLAIQHWAEIIQVIPGASPAIFNIGTIDDFNAFAFSPLVSDALGTPTNVQAALTGQQPGELINGGQGFIQIGTLPWSAEAYQTSQLPQTADISLTTTMVHEIGHALGVSSNFGGHPQEDGSALVYIGESPNAWITHLYDDNGQKSRPNQIVWCSYCDNIAVDDDGNPLEPEDIFDVRNNQAYFAGTHVDEVLAGGMRGVPLSMVSYVDPEKMDVPFMAHIELKNSLMSHQPYRNYTNFMEAELAILQDLGYKIDRRNFFGFSVYGDNQTLINDNPFFGRNADGTAYVNNSYNTATLGLGLHVYGSNNRIAQRADLLSAGAGGAGIRVDGANNDVTVLSGTRIYADGVNGRGVMFAYGKGHNFTHRGDIQALDTNGVAVSFDFGHNMMGDAGELGEYRGSYILRGDQSLSQYTPEALQAAWNEVNGALVDTFNLSGRLAGAKAAIYMSDNAYVGTINVMDGAQIFGDILSNYAEKDGNGNLRLTNLVFGLQKDEDGNATTQADDDFFINYQGNMIGANLSLQLAGGVSVFSGQHELDQVNVAQAAMLGGSGNYLINPANYFTNHGTVAPLVTGESIIINGNYVQAASGTLQLALDNTGTISSLVVNGKADLGGMIAFAPQRGWYANGFSVISDKWLEADTLTGSFDGFTTALDSPTLTAVAMHEGGQTYTVSFSHDASAYSRYARTVNGLQSGLVLDGTASFADERLRPLLAALDFSAADGSTITSALPQLTGEAYASAKSALINNSVYIRSAVYNRLNQAFGVASNKSVSVLAYETGQSKASSKSATAFDNLVGGGKQCDTNDLPQYEAWGYVFGDHLSQSGDAVAAGSKSNIGGFMTGIDTVVYDNWRLGLMAGYSHSSFKVKNYASSGSSDNYTLGTYAGTQWDMGNGALAFRSGLAYTWHDQDMSRQVAFETYHDRLSTDYDGATLQAFGELGYKVKMGEKSAIEPYANLAYVHLKTNGFSESGLNGASLAVHADKMNTTFSMLGLRASTLVELGGVAATARADLGWQHAYGDTRPHSNANFFGTDAFTVTGTAIGKDTALFDTGLDFQLSRNTVLGLSYQGQFGSGISRNSVNANFSLKF